METYCVSFKRITANKNSSDRKIKQNRLILLRNCTIFGKRKLSFIKSKSSIKYNSNIQHYLRLRNNCFILIIFEMINFK